MITVYFFGFFQGYFETLKVTHKAVGFIARDSLGGNLTPRFTSL